MHVSHWKITCIIIIGGNNGENPTMEMCLDCIRTSDRLIYAVFDCEILLEVIFVLRWAYD